jgi:hypothetical protein
MLSDGEQGNFLGRMQFLSGLISWIEVSFTDDGFRIALTASLLTAAVMSTGIYTIRRFGAWEPEEKAQSFVCQEVGT